MKFRDAITAQVEAAIDRQMDRDIDAAFDDTEQRLDEMCSECDDEECPLSPAHADEQDEEAPSHYWRTDAAGTPLPYRREVPPHRRREIQDECIESRSDPGYDDDDYEPRRHPGDYF